MSQVHENLTRGEAAGRVAVVHDPTYDIHLDLTRGDDVFDMRTVVRFGSSAGEQTFLDCTASSIQSVTLNGRDVPSASVQDSRILLTELEEMNEVVVAATMNFTREGRGLHHFRDPTDGVAYLHSQFEPFDAHTVFACFDQPDIKATYELSVEAPAGWVVVSNTAVRDQPAAGSAGTWHFERTPLLSTYLVAIVAGGYVSVTSRHGDTDMAIWSRASLKDHIDAEEIFEITRQGLDWFGEAFGHPYPFGKYDQLFVPEFAMGAMEHPGCVTFTEAYVFRSKVTDAARERRAETILHEMAHMWFGDLVTMRWWDDLWLNESFATFMSVLALVEATRFSNAWITFLDSEKAWAKYQDQLPTTHPIAADAPDVETANQNFDGITYAKGASVLRQLVAWVGQDAFLEGCREYFRAHAWGNATLDDFLGALERSSGRDLDAWRDEWLLTTGVNTLVSERDEAADLLGTVTVIQRTGEGDPAPRRQRVQLGLYGEVDGVIRRYATTQIDLTGPRQDVTELADQPRPELLLVNDADLTYAKVVLDATSTRTATSSLARIEDPLARALLWAGTWDMVRDGELPARRFADQVAQNVHTETEVGVLQRLLGRAVSALDRYGDPANRDGAMARLAKHARAAVDAAQPGSDHQLAWVRHWATSARDAQSASEVEDLLEGRLVVDGLVLDTDLRWHLVAMLASTGAMDSERIDRELLRDPTDLGERAAAAAGAMRPTKAAKHDAWSRLVDGDDLSHTMARELFRGFGLMHQAEVLAPFEDLYLEVVPGIATTRGMDAAVEFVEETFPHANPSALLLERVDGFLDQHVDLARPVRRALLEQRDVLRRTIIARQVDAGA